jgi:hypothetical protein
MVLASADLPELVRGEWTAEKKSDSCGQLPKVVGFSERQQAMPNICGF